MNTERRQFARRTDRRRGFTLLEVLLSLGLSVLLLAAIAMAVDFHLRLLDAGRAEVEQAQLARAILRRIADDLRNALQYTPSATSASNSADSSSGTSGATTSSTSEASTTESSDESTLEDQQTTDRTSNLAQATSLPALPGVYGNDHELQIDVSRVPRLDQMQAMLSQEGALTSTSSVSSVPASAVGDLRTVLYFTPNALSGAASLGGGGGGLLRREMDRASATLAMQQGDSTQLQGPEEPLAPEVQGLEFRYFDGTDWVETWDTTDRSGLPLAVLINLWLTRPPKRSARMGLWPGEGGEQGDLQQFQLLVHLPAARATTSSSSTLSSTAESTDTTTAPQQ
jgi:prepilin-type N-terminal cleavage/methylation domain-containing protein